jgi:hypothetical protein
MNPQRGVSQLWTATAACRLALFILAPQGQSILADYGFTSGALPQKDL